MIPIHTLNGKPYYVLSMSGISTFKRCRKAFDLGYVRGYETRDPGLPVEYGASVHRHLEALATGTYDVLSKVQEGDEMAAIAWAYNAARPIPTGEHVIGVEQPMYVVLIEPEYYDGGGLKRRGVILRCTFDLAYKQNGWTVLRDYKTFDRAPTLHVDLDFQGRIYTAAGMRFFQTGNVYFEYEYIRRTLPNVPKDKAGKAWTDADCYVNVPLMISEREAGVLWEETQWVAHDIVATLESKRYYREDLKVGPHACSSCFWRHGCATEIEAGALTPDAAELFYTIRPPIVIENGATIIG